MSTKSGSSWVSGTRLGTVSQHKLLSWGENRLQRAGIGAHESRLLLEWALNTESLLKVPAEVGIRAAERYRSAVAQRCQHFPLQHITGEMYFRNLVLQAGPGVFCVRPETELLVDLAIECLAPADQVSVAAKFKANVDAEGTTALTKVADLCAGSGAIGLALGSELSNLSIHAIELSGVAAAYAGRNLDANHKNLARGTEYELTVGDAVTAFAGQEGSFDLIVTNPPYVPGQPPLQPEVLFDPEMALYGGGEDGMVVPRGIIVRSAQLLKAGETGPSASGGWLLMEHDDSQGPGLVDFALQHGFREAETVLDLAGKPRFLRSRR